MPKPKSDYWQTSEFCDLGTGKCFLDHRRQKTLKVKSDKEFIKIKNLSPKDIFRIIGKEQTRRKYSQNILIHDKGLVKRIHKELYNSIFKNPIKNGQKICIFFKNMQTAKNLLKENATSLISRQMQIKTTKMLHTYQNG